MLAPSPEKTTMIDPQFELQVGVDAQSDLDHALEIFLLHRNRLLYIAYRVTQDASGAEDVIQESWLRWQRTDRSQINNPAAFLTTTTMHLAINVIQSARHRHEAPSKPQLTELVDWTQDPGSRAEQAASVEQTLFLLMSRLTPTELAAYVLRKAFDYTYHDIGALLHRNSTSARQLVHRAQSRIDRGRKRAVDHELHRLLVTAFLTGTRTGDLESLETLLAQERWPRSAEAGTQSRRPACGRQESLPSRAA